ncbi:MAG: TldD/PmbA family protein [Acidimicrobiia bacterium]
MTKSGETLELAEKIVGWAIPGENLEVFVARSSSTSVRAYGGEVESLTSATSAGCGIRVVADDGRVGFASAGSLDEIVLKETLEDARDNLAYAEADEHMALAEPDGENPPELDLLRPGLAAFPTTSKVDIAIDLERRVMAADPRIKGIRYAAFSDSIGEQAIASTTGIRAWGTGGHCSISVAALATDGTETAIAGGFSLGRDPDDLDIDLAVEEAVRDATGKLGAKKPKSARITVVLEPAVTSDFISIIGGTLSGESVLKGRSLFANRVGEVVASDVFTLVDDPSAPGAFGSWPTDDEGLVSRRNVLIDGGRLDHFLHNTWSGRRSGEGSTGSAVRGYGSTPGVGARSLALAPGSQGREDILRSVGDGVLIQDVSGLHSGVNPVSGDFSVGAEGFWIRNGEPAEPFREATIASTLQRMLQDVVTVGNDTRWFGSTAGVTLVIKDVSLGGN